MISTVALSYIKWLSPPEETKNNRSTTIATKKAIFCCEGVDFDFDFDFDFDCWLFGIVNSIS